MDIQKPLIPFYEFVLQLDTLFMNLLPLILGIPALLRPDLELFKLELFAMLQKVAKSSMKIQLSFVVPRLPILQSPALV